MMNKMTKTVPLVIYGEGGSRSVIGEAVVELDGGYISVEGKITDDTYRRMIQGDLGHLSIRADSITITEAKDGLKRCKAAHPSNFKTGKER